MDSEPDRKPEQPKTSESMSTVKTIISWLVETDREYRATQTFINEKHRKP